MSSNQNSQNEQFRVVEGGGRPGVNESTNNPQFWTFDTVRFKNPKPGVSQGPYKVESWVEQAGIITYTISLDPDGRVELENVQEDELEKVSS
ncbi:hypothetical protein IAQ61_000908 [Plenodomus lingam]|uniref:Predicted protein n=1 Tax=Leptosphaeria maculans (strain JN3 / isolate v23.1.3 / race Av1-4-5-6-7-8) TaxID=985895 RepID=E5A2W4_LEPMJ|nr:predicted protein [Plenodomus lingam JN3]KAH9880614.1 hypothetical protein IAQ61_000908 [Plenodomus lingam]CBX97910.1 predicted protein [Plenodomus lingam JN3]